MARICGLPMENNLMLVALLAIFFIPSRKQKSARAALAL
jgi:hypothetical protein